MTPEEAADAAQDWKGMDGATAFLLIERHADGWDEVQQMMDAWLRANVAAAVLSEREAVRLNMPPGWKLVPEEPTEEMLAATSWPGCAKTDYRHMLRAAPQPAQQPVSGADELLRLGPHMREGKEISATMEEAADEIERLREEIRRLLDSREREGDRLDWLLARLPGSVIRDLVGVMSDTRDVGEWRDLIDKAAGFAPSNAIDQERERSKRPAGAEG